MKYPFAVICTAACLSTAYTGAHAQEVGRVISSTPIVQQVAVPRQICDNQQVVTEGRKSGAGAVMGAIAGGAVGHQIGNGSGRALASMTGIVGGAVLGNQIESGAPELRNVQNCSTQTTYETRTTGYNVVYDYMGKRYTAQMPQDPGPTVRVQVTPVAPTPRYNSDAPPEDSAPRY